MKIRFSSIKVIFLIEIFLSYISPNANAKIFIIRVNIIIEDKIEKIQNDTLNKTSFFDFILIIIYPIAKI